MNEFPQKYPNRRAMLDRAYGAERLRLSVLSEHDKPQGDYASPVFGEGNTENATVLFIGEAPGREEAASGRPFVGKAGRQLDTLLEIASIPRDKIYITNTVKYRPVTRSAKSVRNRTPGPREVVEALPLLRTEISVIAPRCIVTLGNTPLTAVLQLAGVGRQTIGEMHGRPALISIDGTGVVLFPLYHPASGIYNRTLVSVMEQDITALGENLVKAR